MLAKCVSAEVGLRTLAPESVDLVITDPPYGISTAPAGFSNVYSGYTPNKGAWDVEPFNDWVPWVCRVLKPSGIFMCFGVFGSLVPVFTRAKEVGMHFQSHISWHKTNPAPNLNRRMLTHANEFILVFSKELTKWYFDYERSKEQNGGKQQHNHIDCGAVRKRCGVTVKPPQLLERYIELFSPRGGLVVDPFAGSFTHCIVAERLGREAIGFEIDPAIYECAIEAIGSSE